MGAWEPMEVTTTGEGAGTFTDLQPGLRIFTESHYSHLQVTSDEPRPPLPGSDATVEQLAAGWGPFTANAG